MSRRGVVVLVLALLGIGGLTAALAWLLDTPVPATYRSRGERLYVAYCVHCHGPDGRGSWRATLFLIRPGDLADPVRMRAHAAQYLFDIIKHGGSPIGRPGMPGFPHLADADVQELVRYVRELSGQPRPGSSETPGSRS